VKGLKRTGGSIVEDHEIVDLFWNRSETAILETKEKYSGYCHYISYNILRSDEDVEECINDAYLNTWNSIPPNRPESLRTYLGKIVRNISINLYNKKNAQKRPKKTGRIIDEFYECLPANETALDDELALKELINNFLASLKQNTRIIFIHRYWYMCSVREIASRLNISESNVKITLLRTRNSLKKYLEKEGISI